MSGSASRRPRATEGDNVRAPAETARGRAIPQRNEYVAVACDVQPGEQILQFARGAERIRCRAELWRDDALLRSRIGQVPAKIIARTSVGEVGFVVTPFEWEHGDECRALAKRDARDEAIRTLCECAEQHDGRVGRLAFDEREECAEPSRDCILVALAERSMARDAEDDGNSPIGLGCAGGGSAPRLVWNET